MAVLISCENPVRRVSEVVVPLPRTRLLIVYVALNFFSNACATNIRYGCVQRENAGGKPIQGPSTYLPKYDPSPLPISLPPPSLTLSNSPILMSKIPFFTRRHQD